MRQIYVFTAFCVLVASLNHSFAGSRINREDFSSFSARFRAVAQNCLLTRFDTMECTHVSGSSPLKPSNPFAQAFYKLGHNGVIGASSGAFRWLEGSVMSLREGEDPDYWEMREAELGFEALLDFARRKAKREGLRDCQKACLATCIASQMITYGAPQARQSWRASLRRGEGVCRAYADIANVAMREMGLRSKTVAGTGYETGSGGRGQKYSMGGHVMVQVKLQDGEFLMEPQVNACEFFDVTFRATEKPWTYIELKN
jgi:hypothetical protein